MSGIAADRGISGIHLFRRSRRLKAKLIVVDTLILAIQK